MMLTLTDILNEMREAVERINKGHSEYCRREEAIRKGMRGTCDCYERNAKIAREAMQKLIDYTEGKDFKVKLELTITMG